MKIYLDTDYKCHTTNDGTMTEIETDFFEGKCKRWIESYRFLPEGESWTRSDGEVFYGQMITPCLDLNNGAYAAQQTYEETLAEINASYSEGVNSI